MSRKLIIEKYGPGNAVVVLDGKEIVDLFIDPPNNSNFYSPSTFVEAKIQRRISKRGGYFVELPNGFQGFLKSKAIYEEGQVLVLLSKVFFDAEKLQMFTDRLKIVSKFFILKLGNNGFSFSRKTPKNFNKKKLIPILEEKNKTNDGIFVICRSQIADLSTEMFNKELEKQLEHQKLIERKVYSKKKYYDGLAKKIALDKYDTDIYSVIEEDGIFDRLDLWSKINALNKTKHLIHDGPSLIFEQTSSFYAIDVNSGKNLKIQAKELNLLASSEICRLIKILGLGGKIIVDFLPCSSSVKREIFNVIKGYFLCENPKIKIWGWTNGGAFEFERERDKSPLKLLFQDN